MQRVTYLELFISSRNSLTQRHSSSDILVGEELLE